MSCHDTGGCCTGSGGSPEPVEPRVGRCVATGFAISAVLIGVMVIMTILFGNGFIDFLDALDRVLSVPGDAFARLVKAAFYGAIYAAILILIGGGTALFRR